MTDLRDAALRYARRGWPVFPCRPRRKQPITEHGLNDATTDPGMIAGWWRASPDANVAIRTGNGLVVLDVDGDEGAESLRALEREHGELPTTASVRTPSGGSHFYFRHRDAIRNSAGRLGLGLDVRADGGYILAPPSVGRNDRTYEADEEAPLATLPEWLAALLRAHRGRNGNGAGPDGEPIPSGQRNQTLTSLAGTMRRGG